METVLILSIISACFLQQIECAAELVLVPGAKTQPKTVGSGLTITCHARGLGTGEDPQLTWTSAQGNVITATEAKDVVYLEGKGTQSLKLVITSVHGEHAGKWICTGVLSGQTQTKTVIFDVWEDISFDAEKLQRPIIYTDAMVNCRVGGSPQPEVTWSKGTQELDRSRFIPKTGGIQILNISRNDNGVYLCKAEIPSRGRYEVYDIEVEVMVPPKLTSPPKMTSGIEGKDLTMYCRASGDPTPKYKWYKDEIGSYVELLNGGRFEINNEEGTMKILRLQVSDDGTYKCVATNKADSAEGTAEIEVMVPPKVVQNDHGDSDVMASIKMICVAKGIPPPEMKWHKVGSSSPFSSGLSGQPMPDQSNSRVTITQNKEADRTRLEMQIDRVEPSDIGIYTCSAHNQAGNDTKNSTVNVWFPPSFGSNPSQVAYAWSGSVNRNITCIIDGNPLPVVTWIRNGETLVPNDTFRIGYTELQYQVVSNLTVRVDFTNEDYIFGDYVCKGINSKGTDQTTINLKKAEHPSAPSTVDVVRESQTWLRLRIGAPGRTFGMPVTGYQIQYSSASTGQQTMDVEIDTERTSDEESLPRTTVDIENLKPSTLYSFSVSARTEVGLGSSKDFQRTTLQTSIPEPVNILSGKVSQSATEYKLTWEKPRDGGSPILHYNIRYRHVTVNKTTNQIIDVISDYKSLQEKNPQATSFQLSGLIPNRTYQIEIDAVNSLGSSPKRHIIITTLFGSNAAGDIVTTEPEPESSEPGVEEAAAGSKGPGDEGMSTGTIVGLVIIIFFILLIIVDVTCYFKNRCGIIMCIRENVCGRGAEDSDRHATLEDGDAKETQPLAEKEPPETEAKGVGAENQAGTVEDEKKQPLLENEERGGEDITANEVTESDKMEEKEPEDKDEKIAEPLIQTGTEAQEGTPSGTPEVDVEPKTETPSTPGESA